MDVAFSLFGTTRGLELCTFPAGRVLPPDTWVEVGPKEVTLDYDGEVYVVRRGDTSAGVVTWIGMYRKAYEIGGGRGGGYFGAGVWLFGTRTEGAAIVALLRYLSQEVERLAMEDGAFIVRLSEIRTRVNLVDVEETLLSQIGQSLKPYSSRRVPMVAGSSSGYVELSDAGHDTPSLGWILNWAQAGAVPFGQYARVLIGLHRGAFMNTLEHVITPLELLHEEASVQAQMAQRLASVEEEREHVEGELRQLRASFLSLQSEHDALVAQISRAPKRNFDELVSLFNNSHQLISEAGVQVLDLEKQINDVSKQIRAAEKKLDQGKRMLRPATNDGAGVSSARPYPPPEASADTRERDRINGSRSDGHSQSPPVVPQNPRRETGTRDRYETRPSDYPMRDSQRPASQEKSHSPGPEEQGFSEPAWYKSWLVIGLSVFIVFVGLAVAALWAFGPRKHALSWLGFPPEQAHYVVSERKV